mmetsp:Transcript_19611/g.36051  ORF Transcript_19611/g.36051 Transcript_19611/m.36051 type:complete len:327 (-) Transcript_19611:2451-3431(-)
MKWTQFDSDKLYEAEENLIALCEVPVAKSVVWTDSGNALVCYQCGQDNDQKLVMLHGYLGGALLYYNLFKHLSQHFHCIAFDMLGMGCSSRPPFTATTQPESEAFFVDSLHSAFSVLELSQFILLGHSFGGYIAGCYAEKFPEAVTHLILLSPVGYSPKAEGYTLDSVLKRSSWSFKIILKSAYYLWKKGITPASLLRIAGPFSTKLVKLYSRKRLRNIPENELVAIESYLEMINLLEGSGEYALVHILEVGAWARSPLCFRLDRLSIPMSFVFGKHDWMSDKGAYLLQGQGLPVEVKTVDRAGHQLFLENPEGTLEAIFESLGII